MKQTMKKKINQQKKTKKIVRSKTFIITQKYVVVVGCVFVCIYMFFNQEKKN